MTDKLHRRLTLAGAMVAIGVPSALSAAPAAAASVSAPTPHLSVRVFASGSATMFQPDDITWLDGTVYAVWQNGVGPTGLPSPTGATTSTVTGYSTTGHRVATWKVAGHADGLAADTASHRLIVTVNEDGNSSLFAISPEAPAGDQVRHYEYNLNPLASGGGTDAVSIYRGVILISASNPVVANGPAVYRARLEARGVAVLHPVFYDNSTASQSVDDTAWATTMSGTLLVTDGADNEIFAVTGRFDPGTAYVAVTPGNSNHPSSRPNYLGQLDLRTGHVRAVVTTVQAKGLLFIP